jgi:hypothetical protein
VVVVAQDRNLPGAASDQSSFGDDMFGENIWMVGR